MLAASLSKSLGNCRRPVAPPVRIDTCIVGDDNTCKVSDCVNHIPSHVVTLLPLFINVFNTYAIELHVDILNLRHVTLCITLIEDIHINMSRRHGATGT